MPPKAVTGLTSTASGQFSPREQEILNHAWYCLESEPKLNTHKLADLAGMTNPGSAANAWRSIRAKLGLITPAAKTPPTPPTKASDSKVNKGNKRKDNGMDEEGTSPKKKRGNKTKAERDTSAGASSPVKQEESSGQDDGVLVVDEELSQDDLD